MLYREPDLDAADRAVLSLIAEQRQRISAQVRHNPRRWIGTIRRRAFARAIRGSNSIEGYHATVEQAVDVVEDETPDERDETWRALVGYREALTYVMQAARDPDFAFDKQFLKSVHFMLLSYAMPKNPGQWRPGAIWIEDARSGDVVYTAPDRERIDGLLGALVDYIRAPPRQDLLVKAAMVHLNLTLIHPFSDGNGRMARAMQTLIIALDGLFDPVFSSLEEWFGRYTDAYYAVLTQVAGGRWSPERSAGPWVRFCLTAHHQQAETQLRRLDESERLFVRIERVLEEAGKNPRMALPLFDAALGTSLTNARYQSEAGVTSDVALRDLKTLVGAGLLDAKGERRGRRYVASDRLRAMRDDLRIRRQPRDPYDLVREANDGAQTSLPL